ncbi:hypothetical protein CC80DRAFT_549512 [Byssothecium circinans]|uniref:Uncharacterized protein n=1 Tax=Byssothecium circinans TaxID=147558 RepID=A0A6A5TSC9_9PLEO|nr:hypothetical protein CC80DRAFT_549512 [Byssothecium circinans]
MTHGRGGSNLTEDFIKELYSCPGYGNNHYNDGGFDPNTKNLRSGTTMKSNTHHCKPCNKPMTKRCWDRAEYIFCPRWVTRFKVVAGVRTKVRVRCAERVLLNSAGCGEHPRNSEPMTQALYNGAKGAELNMEMFKDPNPTENYAVPPPESNESAGESAELDELIDKMEADGEEVTEEFISDF